jgi:hypothetical protein
VLLSGRRVFIVALGRSVGRVSPFVVRVGVCVGGRRRPRSRRSGWVHGRLGWAVGRDWRFRLGIVLRHGQLSSTGRHWAVRVRDVLASIRRWCAAGRWPVLIVSIGIGVSARRRASGWSTVILDLTLFGIRVWLSVSRSWTFIPSSPEFAKLSRCSLARLLRVSSTGPVFIVSRSLDCVLGHFDNLASLALFPSRLLRQVRMDRC